MPARLIMPDYQTTIEYLFTKLPMFSRIGMAAYKADLSNTLLLCNELGNPQKKIKTIHVAGTNGKGSTSHMLAAIFQSAGYKTGLYTSPHLKDFRERIKINGEKISQEFVCEFVENLQEKIEEIEPSFFEITVAMAFSWFEKNSIDIAIIETGLGGRLDSTNVIQPELSVITNIGYDHMQILGDTLQQIAFEKAGIIKWKTPVVIGETNQTTKAVFLAKAEEVEAEITFADEEYNLIEYKSGYNSLKVTVQQKKNLSIDHFEIDLPGLYQTKNLITVLSAIHRLNKSWKINKHSIYQGLLHVKLLTGLHGRWEVIHKSPLIILDVAHNEDGIKQVSNQLQSLTFENLHIIIGMVRDKKIDTVLSLLPKNSQYYFTNANLPRALPAIQLQALAQNEHGLSGESFNSVNEALQHAVEKASLKDLILVCGSVFVVGEVDIAKIRL